MSKTVLTEADKKRIEEEEYRTEVRRGLGEIPKQKPKGLGKGCLVVIIVFIALGVIGSLFSSPDKKKETNKPSPIPTTEYELKPTPTSEPTQTATPSPTIKKIGVSYNQMMNYLLNFFTMEKSTPVDGEDRYMGTTSSGLATLEIIGGKDNITQTSLMIGIPNDSPSLVTENSAIMLRFLKNAVPEWEDITEWFTASAEEFTHSSSEKIEKLYGDKVIELTLIKQLGMMTATVKHK